MPALAAAMRAHTTRLKNWNRFVYYTLKILVLGGVFYLVFLA